VATPGASGVVRFGAFEFDLSTRELRKGRTRLRVPDQSLAILAMLLECPGEVVAREAIQARLWPHGTVVEFEHSVNSAVKRLRQALLDTASTPRFVETLPRKGYRFIGSLEPLAGEPPGLTPGTIVSHYRILAEAGRGAMGVVYKAEDTSLGRMVALKFLPDELATHQPALERLRREARMIGALNHPGICTVYELGESGGRVFLVMEFLEGESLRERMARGPLSKGELFDVAVQVAKALEAAHGQDMVHRDIKPDNLFLTRQGVVKLMDFGLAKPVEEESGAAPQSSVTGTSGYMSPEQVRGEPLDARSDMYSLGRVLTELAGKSLPAGLAAILRKALADDPAKRWQSATSPSVATPISPSPAPQG
jgi:DNA-binding winged helix-turn-helix (wHTH) protein